MFHAELNRTVEIELEWDKNWDNRMFFVFIESVGDINPERKSIIRMFGKEHEC